MNESNAVTNQINLERLTPSRRKLLSDALGGHSLQVSAGKFTTQSSESLSKIGLTPIEINALEVSNVQNGNLKIPVDGSINSSNNPWLKDNWNPEKQRHILETDNTMAIKLMREAGLLN